LEFEWDEDKAASNQKKHRVTFEEAATVFADPLAVIFDDEVTLRRSSVKSSSAIRPRITSCWSVLPSVRELFGSSAPAVQRKGNDATMKKTRTANQAPERENDLLPEYHFDYSKARPNRFAARLRRGSRAVVLDPDVAAVFSTPESVNAVLRALIETMPQKSTR
jgi:hypothetical protein